MTSLSDEQRRHYEAKGIVFPIDVLPAEKAAEYLAAANDVEKRIGGKPKATDLSELHLHFSWAYELVCNSRVLDAVESLLGPDIIAWSAGLFPKHPRDPSFISWHQDGTYWNLDSTQVATAWIALSDSVPENGCMRVVEGSHAQGIHQHKDTYAADNALSRGQEVQVEVDDETACDVVLKAGQMSLHHVRIIHGSNANQSDDKRVGFVVRYVTPQVKQQGTRPDGVLVRGEDRYGNFDLLGPPQHPDMETAIAAQRESARRQLASVMLDARK